MKPNKRSITVSNAAVSYTSHLCSKHGASTEIGGLGLGSYDERGDLVVMAMLPPGPKAELSAICFVDDVNYINTSITFAKERYGLSPLLFWHLHPGDYSEPSHTDLNQCIRFTHAFRLPALGYMIMTRQNKASNRNRFWGKYLAGFNGKTNPLITIHSYIFDTDQSQYEPCCVRSIDYDGVQQEILNCDFIPERYKLRLSYPTDKIKIIDAIASAPSIPASFTNAFSRIAELITPDIFVDGHILNHDRS